jgi:hypothetical protein
MRVIGKKLRHKTSPTEAGEEKNLTIIPFGSRQTSLFTLHTPVSLFYQLIIYFRYLFLYFPNFLFIYTSVSLLPPRLSFILQLCFFISRIFVYFPHPLLSFSNFSFILPFCSPHSPYLSPDTEFSPVKETSHDSEAKNGHNPVSKYRYSPSFLMIWPRDELTWSHSSSFATNIVLA